MTHIDAKWFDRPLRIGTRRSQLALWQAHHVEATLKQHWGERLSIELVEIVTEGDRVLDRPLSQVGGKGLFVKGIEDKLLADEVDLAVHSMKDLPAVLPGGLVINCTPPRADPRDALVSKSGLSLADLPEGTRLGTSSLRRGALAQRLNPGLEVVSIRGNVPTRLKKVDDGEVDATLLAVAGLERLGLADRISERLDVARFCPAACQGILALECRRDDARVMALCEPMNDARAGVAAAAERAFLRRLEGGCQVPMGCYCEVGELADPIHVRGVVIGDEGRPYLFAVESGPSSQAAQLGDTVAQTLLSMGADQVIAALAADA